jgi:hypothetical protein
LLIAREKLGKLISPAAVGAARITVHAGEELGIWRFCGSWLNGAKK